LVMPDGFDSMLPRSSNAWSPAWRSIAGNLVMPEEFESMLPSSNNAWRSIAGNLNMPDEFLNILPQLGNVCSLCNVDHPIEMSCPSRRSVNMAIIPAIIQQSLTFNLCRHCSGDHPTEIACPYPESDLITDCLINLQSFPGQSLMCIFCGGNHNLNQSCPCFRCGVQHIGVCPTICRLCRRSHPSSRSCRASAHNFTARRRLQAIFCDDEVIAERALPERHFLGLMLLECPHCKAKSWRGEKLSCCHRGAVHLLLQDSAPPRMSALILSPHVRQNIRPYNTIMAFASTGHQNKSIVGGTFVLGGRAYHRMGSLLPGDHLCCDGNNRKQFVIIAQQV
jgi:hypothetical protein